MAAIDKIYIDTYDQYVTFKNWCESFPSFKDKYRYDHNMIDFLYKLDADDFKHGERPVMMNDEYVDALIIRNCPLDFIQDRLKIMYGFITQDMINEMYDCVMDRTEENKNWYTWMSPDDFILDDEGIVHLKNPEKSTYEQILDNEYMTLPYIDYEHGRHLKLLRKGKLAANTPFGCRSWFINVDCPKDMGYMWCHSYKNKNRKPTWDFTSEFVGGWDMCGSDYCVGIRPRTLRAAKKLIISWGLPIGSIVRLTGRYIDDYWEFIVKK